MEVFDEGWTGSRKYTEAFRRQAVRQVLDGVGSVPQVARSLEVSAKSLANWVAGVKRGQPLLKRPPRRRWTTCGPVTPG